LKIKRYLVRDMKEAIRLIKQDLGPEALIVGSYKVPAKGILGFFSPRRLEVTAVLDENTDLKLAIDERSKQLLEDNRQAAGQFSAPAAGTGVLPAAGPNSHARGKNLDTIIKGPKEGLVAKDFSYPPLQTDVVAGQLKETGSLFDTMVSQHAAPLPGNPLQKWREILYGLEVQEDIADKLLSFLDNDSRQAVVDDLIIYDALLKQTTELIAPVYQNREKARILTFIGPAGVGKTTTLAKLATDFVLKGNKEIVLINVNTYRIGYGEQVQAYGDFLGIPTEVVMTPAELASVVENHSDKDYIFIDTQGRSAHNAGQLLELKGFLRAVKEPQDIFLVLNSAVKSRDLNRIADEFQKAGYSKLIFTRIDETETYGAILNLICCLGKPVAYLTDGQVIPDDIREADPRIIAKLLLRGVDPNGVVVARQ
jgi:flagellar biosynthesis protein FlhF